MDEPTIEVVMDFETASATDLRAAGAWRYAECPTTEIISLTYEVVGFGVFLWVPGQEDERLLKLVNNPRAIFIAHNVGFDKAIWRILMTALGWPDLPNSRWHDTMSVCAMRVIPMDLDRSLQVLNLPFEKDKEGSKLTKSLSKPDKRGNYDRSPATLARVYEYNRSDIAGTTGLHGRLGYLPPAERNVWLLDQRVNERGVKLDMQFVSNARRVVEDAVVPLIAEFRSLTGVNPTQDKKFKAWMAEYGVVLPDLKKETLTSILGPMDGEDEIYTDMAGYDEWLMEAQLPSEVERALRIRQLSSSASIKKLARMEQCVCADGRVRGLLQYHGTGPGLWAGRLFQPQNFPRGTLQVGTVDKHGKDTKRAPDPQFVVDTINTGDYQFVESTLGPAVETVVSSLRHTIISEYDRELVVGDFAGIQARLTLAAAGQYDKVALMASGADIYIDMAHQIYKPKVPFTKEANVEERQTGKNAVLGLGFQMGMRKFRFRYAQHMSEEFCQQVVDTYRKEWAPCVPKLWYGLEGAAVRTVWDKKPHEFAGVEYRLEDGWLTARLPSGNKLWYFNPQPVRKAMPWDRTDIRMAWTYQSTKMNQFRTIDAFGGLLTENYAMGMQRALLVRSMFRCERENLPVILNVHDELLTEPKKDARNKKLLEDIMGDVPQWAKDMRVPVLAEVWSGPRYKKG